MQPDERNRLRHMLEAAQEALEFTAGKSRDDLDHDRQLVLALLKCIEIIGEAAVHVSSPSRKRMPEIPWQNIIDMRNVLIHVYHDVDVNIVWDTITEDLPPLVEQLKKIVPPQHSSN